MEQIKVTLCPACSGCPSVEITDQGVTIGENETPSGSRTPNGTISWLVSGAENCARCDCLCGIWRMADRRWQ